MPSKMFLLLPKIYQLPEYYTMIARKIFFLPNWGATVPLSLSPTPMSQRLLNLV